MTRPDPRDVHLCCLRVAPPRRRPFSVVRFAAFVLICAMAGPPFLFLLVCAVMKSLETLTFALSLL